MIVAFDLDGTLADLTHRLHFIQSAPKRWGEFFGACDGDKPILEMIEMLLSLYPENLIEIWSGRSDAVRDKTVEWLRRNGIHPRHYHVLRMRKAGDYRDDAIVKGEWLDALPPNMRPHIAFDDRDRVVAMWRKRGIRCCQVAPGNF